MANVFRADDSEVFARHRANIAASLAHRLNVARATQNMQLVALLEQEQRQLGLKTAATEGISSLTSRLSSWWYRTQRAIANSSKMSVERIKSDAGEIFWHAYDPKTGMALYAESESEVVKWIEDNRLGR